MDWKFLSLASLGFGALVAGMISGAADRHYSKAVSDIAASSRDEGIDEELEHAKKTIEQADQVAARERKEILEGVRAWKRQSGYDEKIREAHLKTTDSLLEFKESISYDTRKQEIEDTYENDLDIFKESIDYDYEMALAEGKIEDAKNLYKRRCKKLDIASGGDSDISDALSDVKKAEKEKMDEAIKEAKSSIASLKNKVSTEDNKLTRKKQAALRELDAEILPTRNRLQKEEQEACKLLENEKTKVETELRATVSARRSAADQTALDLAEDSHMIIDRQIQKDAELAKKLYENAAESEKWGRYFKAHGVPKVFVGTAGVLPLVPVGYLVWKYTKFVAGVIRAM